MKKPNEFLFATCTEEGEPGSAPSEAVQAFIKEAIVAGGPANPVTVTTSKGAHVTLYGKTLRDSFAEAALQGICAHVDTWGLSSASEIAAKAYEISDAMLAQRDKP